MTVSSIRIRTRRNWYRIHPHAAGAVAAALFGAVSIAAWFNDSPGQALVVLYVLPIALLAVTAGLAGGLVGAATGFGLFAVLATTHGGWAIGFDGWVVRAVVMFLLGGLLGHARDQNRANERAAMLERDRRCHAEDANRRYAEAMELSDSLIQQMAVAKWMAEAGRSKEAAEVLAATIEAGEAMARGLLQKRIGAALDDVPDSSGGAVDAPAAPVAWLSGERGAALAPSQPFRAARGS